jgi:hypothetical protein
MHELSLTNDTNQIVNILTKVMMEVLKSNDSEQDGSLVSHHNLTNGNANGHHKNKIESVYEIIANVLNESMESMNIQQLKNTFTSANMKELVLEKLSTTIGKVETLSKLEDMKQSLMQGGSSGSSMMPQIMVNDNDFIVEQFCDIVEDIDVGSAFSAMTKNNPQLMMKVLDLITNCSNPATSNLSMKELIQKAIVAAVKEESSHQFDELLATNDTYMIENLLNDSLILAKALGMTKEATAILSAFDKVLATGKYFCIKIE